MFSLNKKALIILALNYVNVLLIGTAIKSSVLNIATFSLKDLALNKQVISAEAETKDEREYIINKPC